MYADCQPMSIHCLINTSESCLSSWFHLFATTFFHLLSYSNSTTAEWFDCMSSILQHRTSFPFLYKTFHKASTKIKMDITGLLCGLNIQRINVFITLYAIYNIWSFYALRVSPSPPNIISSSCHMIISVLTCRSYCLFLHRPGPVLWTRNKRNGDWTSETSLVCLFVSFRFISSKDLLFLHILSRILQLSLSYLLKCFSSFLCFIHQILEQ